MSHARRRARHGRIGFWYRLAVVILRPPLTVITRRDWRGAEHLPADGGVVVVTNHISHVDPLIFAHFLYDNGKLPRFLGKEVLFRLFFVGSVLRGAKQIPVYRESADAATAFSAAVAAVRAGECVVVYPEATLSRDPGLWPMVGKTGAARVALETRAPVVPIAQWGPQEMLPPYGKRPRLLPRKPCRSGPVRRWSSTTSTTGRRPPMLREATERIMAADHRAAAQDPRRAAAGGALRPANAGAAGHREPRRTTDEDRRGPHDASRGARRRVVGDRLRLVLADAGRRRRPLGPPRGGRDAINERAREPRLPPGHRAAAGGRGDRRPRARRSTVPRSSCSRCRRRRCAPTSTQLGAAARRRTRSLVSLMKGIELGTTKRMSEVIAEVAGSAPERIAVVSGPNLAREIAERQPAASVVACVDEAVAEKLQQRLPHAVLPAVHQHRRRRRRARRRGQERHRAGGRHGRGHGHGRQLAGRRSSPAGWPRSTRLGLALGADPATFAGLAGVGDLIATCMSPLSRNRTFGEMLGRGMTVAEVVACDAARPPRA